MAEPNVPAPSPREPTDSCSRRSGLAVAAVPTGATGRRTAPRPPLPCTPPLLEDEDSAFADELLDDERRFSPPRTASSASGPPGCPNLQGPLALDAGFAACSMSSTAGFAAAPGAVEDSTTVIPTCRGITPFIPAGELSTAGEAHAVTPGGWREFTANLLAAPNNCNRC